MKWLADSWFPILACALVAALAGFLFGRGSSGTAPVPPAPIMVQVSSPTDPDTLVESIRVEIRGRLEATDTGNKREYVVRSGTRSYRLALLPTDSVVLYMAASLKDQPCVIKGHLSPTDDGIVEVSRIEPAEKK